MTGDWLLRIDPETGRQTLGRVFADGQVCESRRPEPQQPQLPLHAFLSQLHVNRVARTTAEAEPVTV